MSKSAAHHQLQKPRRYTMNLKNAVLKAAVIGALGLPALGLGIGAATASADPGGHGQPCGVFCPGDNGGDHGFRGDDGNHGFRGDGGDQGFRGDGDGRTWDQRGIDDARFDHQPFNYEGQRVEPYFDNDRGVFGFLFFGVFVAL
jgi:hypothetical protein